jgi:tetratricopeptide (TPR) repeat protein
VASSGDLKKTDEAIKGIETLGASHGQVRLLRGMVAYFRGDAEAAISDLEQAVKLLPKSVTARALLAVSYIDYGQQERSGVLLDEMESLRPSSPEDYLFKGLAYEYYYEVGQGLADMNEGIKQRDSPLGRALRASALTNRALDRADLQDAEAALADADLARRMLPNNPLALSVSLHARAVAAALYQEAKLTGQRTALLRGAERDIQALDPSIAFPFVGWGIWAFYELTGDADRALDAARRSLEASGSPNAAWCAALQLYGQGRTAEVKRCLERRRETDLMGDLVRVLTLAELTDGKRQALQEYDKLIQKYPLEGWNARHVSLIALLLGKRELALAAYEKYGTHTRVRSESTREFRQAQPQFARGELSEEKFLAKAGTSRFNQLSAHYEMGVARLAAGDRENAREHFRKAVATRAIWIFDYNWCAAFLNRLEKDATWPRWIPVKP